MKRNKSNIKLLSILLCGVVFMYAFSYMMVPIFTFVCKQLGINGKGGMTKSVASNNMQVDMTRSIKVEFATTRHGSLNFAFKPMEKSIMIHPGEHKTIYFYAANLANTKKTVQAVPSITPSDAARFLKKIECFCFTQQTFSKHEKAKMPVNFYIEPSVGKDIKEITLSYTLFDATGYENKKQQQTPGRIRVS